MALLRYFGVDFFLCFVRFFAVVDSSRRAAIVPGFVVDSSHLFIRFRLLCPSLKAACFSTTLQHPEAIRALKVAGMFRALFLRRAPCAHLKGTSTCPGNACCRKPTLIEQATGYEKN